ncbi:hypothetical protein J3Q64DRAFT_1767298 [Phycomyces blakesleeanus]|uniref:Rhodanese domain-containing protein n=1 Tax=Phycomyces blakesleeanus TaxID=4837 RepID=A0ABR3ANV3_PHYBL
MTDKQISRKLRRQAIHSLLHRHKNGEDEWSCCETRFSTPDAIGRHLNACHSEVIQAKEDAQRLLMNSPKAEIGQDTLKQRRVAKGDSDPIRLECSCDMESSMVILFYSYGAVPDPASLAKEHLAWEKEGLTGKVRIASEGINGTLAGNRDSIQAYIDWLLTMPCMETHRNKDQKDFFKPSRGCRHVFVDLSVKLVEEICPLGRPEQVTLEQLSQPRHAKAKLSPESFHEQLKREDVVLLDTRNYYESRIGHFEGAIKPAIRKFSRFPDYVDRNKESLEGKTILTYCTGGIRCEKATAYMRQALSDETDIMMLDGGIHNYLEWWGKQSKEKKPLWQGKNYVFDARQGLGVPVATAEEAKVSHCSICQVPWDTYLKCASVNCHLLVLYCTDCLEKGHIAYCCDDCGNGIRGTDGVCGCERKRRLEEMSLLAL